MSGHYTEDYDVDEFLAHYGVKGMKWGVRRRASGRDIKAARRRQDDRRDDFNDASKEVRRAENDKARAKAETKKQKARDAFNNSDDRAIAVKMTRGEQAAALIIAGPFGLMPIVASEAVSVAISKGKLKS